MGDLPAPVTREAQHHAPMASCVNNVCKDPNPIEWIPPGRVSVLEKPFCSLWLQSIK